MAQNDIIAYLLAEYELEEAQTFTVAQISKAVHQDTANVSRQIMKLHKAGLLEGLVIHRTAFSLGRMVYRINPDKLKEARKYVV